MKKKLLFVVYGGGHINALLPVIVQLIKDKRYMVEVLALTTSGRILEANGIPFRRMMDFADHGAVTIGRPLAEQHHQLESGIPFDESVAYYGLCMRDLINRHGITEAQERFQCQGRQAFLPIETLRRIICTLEADAVITTSSPRAEEAALIAAVALGLPAVRVEQFFATSDRVPSSVVFCVMNEYVKKALLAKGVPEESIHVTGQPAFDALKQVREGTYPGLADLTRLKEDMGIGSAKKVIMWASQNTQDKNLILEQLLIIEKANDDITLIIKLHPNDSEELYQAAIDRYHSGAILIKTNLYEMLLIADVVVTKNSTVGLEAILLNKPLVTVNPTGEPDKIPYADSGAALRSDLKSLENQINMVLYDEETRIKLAKSRCIYINDGRAADRVCGVIESLLHAN